MDNQVQFVCLRCCVPPDLVVQINNFFSLDLFSVVIHKRRGMKLINKINEKKLDSSSKTQFFFFIQKHSKKFLESYRFCQKSGNDALYVIMNQCARKSICDSPISPRKKIVEALI